MREVLVIIEGAGYAPALSRFLKENHNFKLVEYNTETDRFIHMLDRLTFPMFEREPRICLVPGHLTARANSKITDSVFHQFEEAVSLAETKLIFAPNHGMPNFGKMFELYEKSSLPKQVFGYGDSIFDVLAWLELEVKPGAWLESARGAE
jgi:hypothetical protein